MTQVRARLRAQSESALPDLTLGHLELTPPSRLMATAYHLRATGTLTLTRQCDRKRIHFREGRIVGTVSNVSSETFGEVLLECNLITAAQYAESTRQFRRGRRKHGEILIAMGYLQKTDILRGLRLQHLERLIDAVNWLTGRYDFRGGPVSARQQPVQLWPVVKAAIRNRWDDAERRSRADLSIDAPLRRTPGPLEAQFLANGEALSLLGRIAEGTTMRSIATDLDAFDGLLALREVGLVDWR